MTNNDGIVLANIITGKTATNIVELSKYFNISVGKMVEGVVSTGTAFYCVEASIADGKKKKEFHDLLNKLMSMSDIPVIRMDFNTPRD